MILGILHSTIRADEKFILEAAKKHNVEVNLVDIRNEIFNPDTYKPNYRIALERSVSTVKGTYAVNFLESLGVKVINNSSVSNICQDKFITSLVLKKFGVPVPPFALTFSYAQALAAVDDLGGFPVVLKPNLGSWGRLLAKINDSDSLEALIEHKETLGSPHQKAYYIQKFIPKPDRDIRAFLIDGNTICAIYRESQHWITNTARGAKASNCPVTEEIRNICKMASDAVGGGILSVDLLETPSGLMVNEVNHTMEFKNSESPTGVSISEEIIKYCISASNS